MKSFPKSRSFASLSSVSRDDDLDSNDPSCAVSLAEKEKRRWKRIESSGGEVVQRIYSAIGGVPGAGESPNCRLAGS